MHSTVTRGGFLFAVLTTSAAFAGCSGGVGTTQPGIAAQSQVSQNVPVFAQRAESFSLGFVAADSTTIRQLAQIRYELATKPLPPSVDLAPKMPPVGNQGQENSCTSWASAYALRGYEARRDVWSAIAPQTTDAAHNFSPAFIYNQTNGGHDGGATLPSVLTLMRSKGAATLADMPYVSGQITTQPTAAAVADAAHYKLSSFGYIAPTDLTSMKTQLAAGLPVVIGIQVYNNFFSLAANAVYTGVAGGYAGGHAVTIVGYDDTKQAVKIINSWGSSWASAGYGWISYSALRQIALEAYSAIDDHGIPH